MQMDPDNMPPVVNPVVLTVTWYGALMILGVFALEHLGRKNDVLYLRPTTYMLALHAFFIPIAWKIGCVITDILTFIAVLDLNEVAITVADLSKATTKISFVWVEIVNGMMARTNQVEEWEWVLSCFAITLITAGHALNGLILSIQIAYLGVLMCVVGNLWCKWSVACPVATDSYPPASPPQRRRRGVNAHTK